MSDPWLWSALLWAIAGGFFSALQLSLEECTRGELEERAGDDGRRRFVEWAMERIENLTLATALWRRACAAGLMTSVLLSLASYNGITTVEMIAGAVGVLLWFWVVDVGLAWSISDHVATPMVASSLRVLPLVYYTMLPLLKPLNGLNEAVRRLAGAEERDELEDDLEQVLEEGEREGNITGSEKEMIEAIVDFRTRTVGEAMTPRIDVYGIELTDDLNVIKDQVLEAGHSRFPVYEESLDHIVGILYAKDLLPFVGRDPSEFRLRPLLREAAVVPESRKISDLLIEFRERLMHMAIVLDEYGGTAGVITVEDIVEEIVGEIRDEHDVDVEPEPEIVRNADGTADVDGRVRVSDLNDELGLRLPEDADYDTVAGWVFANAGRIPGPGDVMHFENVEVKVLQVERTRLQRLRLRILDNTVTAEAAPPDRANAD